MNRICAALFVAMFPAFLNAGGHGPGTFIPCVPPAELSISRVEGSWIRDDSSVPPAGEHGIPTGAQFKEVAFHFNSDIMQQFADFITTDDFCVYASGTMTIKRNSNKISSYPFVLSSVDNILTPVWISGVKDDYKILEAISLELNLGAAPTSDTLLLGGEYDEDPKTTFHRETSEK